MSTAASRIVPKLSTFDASMVVVSLVIGIGIFRTPAVVAKAAQSPALFLAAWALGAAVSLMGAFTFAEIGSRFPRAGGYYKVVAECYHPAVAFMLNWSQALMQGAGAAGVAFIGAEYLVPLLVPAERRGPRAVFVAAFGLMLVLLLLNALGIKSGARTQNVLSALKVVMIVGLAAAGLLLAPHAEAAAPASPVGLGGLLAALVPVFYAYGGYQNTMNMGADVVDPRRNLPRAIVMGVGLVAALYLTINLAYLAVLGIGGVAAEKLVASAVARAAFGPAGSAIVSAAIFLSAAGFVNATILAIPRSYIAMAEDGAVPRAFLKVNPKTQVQGFGLGFFAATMLIPAFFLGSFEKLLNYVIFTDSLMVVAVASTVFVLRKRGVGGDEGFRVAGYPVVPVLFMLVLVAVALQIVVAETALAIAGTVVLLLGWPLFLLGRKFSAPHS